MIKCKKEEKRKNHNQVSPKFVSLPKFVLITTRI